MKYRKYPAVGVAATKHELSQAGAAVIIMITDEEMASARSGRRLLAERLKFARRDLRYFLTHPEHAP